jgi:hypothetical protein
MGTNRPRQGTSEDRILSRPATRADAMDVRPALAVHPNCEKKGLIALNRSAYALIGDPEAVELLWDADRKVIGVRAAELVNPNAYPARPQSSNTTKGPVLVAGTKFTQFIGMDTSRAMRWVPTVEDNILCIDISKPGQLASSNRTAKADSEKTSSASVTRSVDGAEASTPQAVHV